MDLVKAVHSLDAGCLNKVLNQDSDVSSKVHTDGINLYYELVDELNKNPKLQQDGCLLVYSLSNYGLDINQQDQNGNTAFNTYIYHSDFLHPDVVEAFLRCNADIYLTNKEGKSVLDRLKEKKLPNKIAEICLNYMPGLWKAVEDDNIPAVRKLVNQWCKVSIHKGGISLLQLALEKGTEGVIRIISGVKISAAIAHGVLAGDVDMVRRLLQCKDKFNVNLKNMGDRSATPLYYAACQNNSEMINLLISNGARSDLCMTYKEFDIPIYFSIMMEYPVVSVETLKLLLPWKPVPVDKMFYKGRNILFHCVDCGVDPYLMEEILQKSSPDIVTQRIEDNLTARDYAMSQDCHQIVQTINKHVKQWSSSEDYPGHRKTLILHGYFDTDSDEVDDLKNELSEDLQDYLNQVEDFHDAVEMCETDRAKGLLYYNSPSTQLPTCLANSRLQGKGQPALHKSVLRRDIETCTLISEALVHQCNLKIDSIRDQYFRTALHYACGMKGGNDFVEMLMEHGCSDFAMDKDGRSPLAFKDRQNLKEMEDLLQFQVLQDFSDPEPDPWSVRLPMPVVGYLMDCAHSHHKHLSVTMAEKLAIELNPIGHAYNGTNHQTNQSNVSFDSTNQQICDKCDNYDDQSEDEDSDDDNQSNPSSSCSIL